MDPTTDSGPPTTSPGIYNPDEWTKIMVNASRIGQGDPRYAKAQQAVADAKAALAASDTASSDPPDDLGSRLMGGIKGTAEGVGDLVTGAGRFAKRVMEASPRDLLAIPSEVIGSIPQAVEHVRDVTQKFRGDEASPEDLARAWTGGAATVLGPMTMMRSGNQGVGIPEGIPGKIGNALGSLERTVAPGRAYARMKLQQASAKSLPPDVAPPPATDNFPDPNPVPPDTPNPNDIRFQQAFGNRPANSDVIDPSSAPSAFKPMDRVIPTGSPWSRINQAMQSPVYQQAATLAAKIVGDPALVKAYPQFAGLSASDATATLQKMILDASGKTGEVPSLTSMPKFLGRLVPPPENPVAAAPNDLAAMGKGKVLPYYTRGGAAEQAIKPFPQEPKVQGPKFPPGHSGLFGGQSDAELQGLLKNVTSPYMRERLETELARRAGAS